jgi:hypothetical protein
MVLKNLSSEQKFGGKKFVQTFQHNCLKNPVLWKIVKRPVVKTNTSVGTSIIYVWRCYCPKTEILFGRIISFESLVNMGVPDHYDG